jgi:hypothetical protein
MNIERCLGGRYDPGHRDKGGARLWAHLARGAGMPASVNVVITLALLF